MRRRPRPWEPAVLSEEVQYRFLDALLQSGTLAEACARTGTTRGAALATRAKNAMFALQWDRINDMRLAEIEALLLEKTVQGLVPGLDMTATQEKFIASLGQWFLEARAGVRYGKKPAKATTRVLPPEAAMEPDAAANDRKPAARKVEELLARTAARLAAAEDRLGG